MDVTCCGQFCFSIPASLRFGRIAFTCYSLQETVQAALESPSVTWARITLLLSRQLTSLFKVSKSSASVLPQQVAKPLALELFFSTLGDECPCFQEMVGEEANSGILNLFSGFE